jgi:2-oxoglutarate/2-oxoacid ferredoxin oxidoreductase subunit beta
MIFGKGKTHGIKINGMKLEKTEIKDESVDSLIHNAEVENTPLHIALAKMQLPEYPVAMGIIRKTIQPNYSESVHSTIAAERKKSPFKNVNDLFRSGNTWDIP